MSVCPYFFLPRSYVFVLNLTESLLKSVKIAFKKIVNPYYIEVPENYQLIEKVFWKEMTLQRVICTRHSLHSSRK